jgi:hypothetical protein
LLLVAAGCCWLLLVAAGWLESCAFEAEQAWSAVGTRISRIASESNRAHARVKRAWLMGLE